MKTVKAILMLSLLLSLFSSKAQPYQYLGTYNNQGLPDYLETPSDVVDASTFELTGNVLPEGYPVPIYNPQYILGGFDADIKITAQAEVWVTFVQEGAGYRNTLGFYTYTEGTAENKPADADITIIFPNVSAQNSGGGLLAGNKVKLGSFEPGTRIGWVLIANGWNGSTVGSGNWKVFSNSAFNPETDAALQAHSVLLKDTLNDRILLGFEDILRDRNDCDNDFNDAIFYVTANPIEAIDQSNIVDVGTASDVSSGNQGGLESNGKLAQLIAQRSFQRVRYNSKKDQYPFQQPLKTVNRLREKSNSLARFMPEYGLFGDEEARVSTPEDLLAVTNAKEVFAVDYYRNDKRTAAILATTTDQGVYDHSKVICDRLNGSVIQDVRVIRLGNHPLVCTQLKNAIGNVEYTLSFSVAQNTTQYILHSYWNLGQYPKEDMTNFQVWGNSYSQIFALTHQIFELLQQTKELVSSPVLERIPSVIITEGHYKNGLITLSLLNKRGDEQAVLTGSLAITETQGREPLSTTIRLNGSPEQQVNIAVPRLFDVGFSLSPAGASVYDELYLADGPWGLDFSADANMINRFDVIQQQTVSEQGIVLERDAVVTGEVKEVVNLFRHLAPGHGTVDLTGFNSLSFDLKSSKDVEVVIVEEGQQDWEHRFRMQVAAADTEERITLNLSQFTNKAGIAFTPSKTVSLVFSVIGNFNVSVPFELHVSNVSFDDQQVGLGDLDPKSKKQVLRNAPNPFSDFTTIVNVPWHGQIALKVFDLTGKCVYSEMPVVNNGRIVFKKGTLQTGVYLYTIQDAANNTRFGRMQIQ